MRPIEAGARIGFSTGGNIVVANCFDKWITFLQSIQQTDEGTVLRLFVSTEIIPLEFYADRKVIATLPSAPAGNTGMPGTRQA